MKPHSTPLASPPVVKHEHRLDINGRGYQHSVLEPHTLPLQDALRALPGLAFAVQKLLDPTKGERFPGAVRATWLDTVELKVLYPGLPLASVGALYHVADPGWLPPHELVREYEGEMLVKELDGETVRGHFRTIQSTADATPTLLIASPFEMFTVYSDRNTPNVAKGFIPLIALAGDTLTVGGFFIDENRFQVTRGVPEGLQRHECPEPMVGGLNGPRLLMAELSTSPWSRGYWPAYREGQLTWMTMTSFV